MKKLFDFSKRIIIMYIEKGIATKSAQLSYYMLFTFFPILLFVNSVLVRIVPSSFELPISTIIPQPVTEFALSYLGEIGESNNVGFMYTGAVLTFYSLSRYIRNYRLSIRDIYGTVRKISFISDWLFSFLLSIGLLVLFYVAVFVVFFADGFLNLMGFEYINENVIVFLGFTVLAFYAYFVINLIQFLECGEKVKFTYFSKGVIIAVMVWIVISVLFSYYAGEVADYSVVYGSIGNVIMLLVWLNITNTILLMSGVLNICLNKKP